jgi:serine/threonine-protein kinase
MAECPDPNQTVNEPDPLDAGLAAAFGPDSGPPLPADGSVLKALGAPPLLLREPASEAPDPVVRPHSDALPTQAPARLQLHGEIARGGMGAVLKGRDTDLGRDLAVKVLLETHAGKTELVQRFVEEAQIAGQLQHPGITPVYELGQFADRRPYFTMKLVKGQTLAALLAARPQVATDRPRLVSIFAQVAQTLAYTHAHGVIHRDLKPANVMVGSFGEVQVMDWGLAKVLKEGGVTDERKAQTQQAVSVVQTTRSAGTLEAGSHTQAGSVLGTPAYMAPEQARGEVSLVDTRADVFGLGAILCEILTGQPPFTGKNAEAMRKAQLAQLEDAWRRLDGCGADTGLVGLARHCLAAEPWDRPRGAGEVAAAVTAYQNSVAERLRQAELAHAAEVARTEEAQATAAQERKAREAAQARAMAERHARRLTLGLAAAVLALVTVGALGGLWLQRQRAERAAAAARQREAVETALDKAHDLGQQGRWAEARAILEQAGDRLGEAGPEVLRQRVEQATAYLALVDRLEAIRLAGSTWIEGKFDTQGAERAYAAAFREAGLGEEGEEAATVAARVRASAVGDHLVAAVDDWAALTEDQTRRTWLLAVARRADPDPWRDYFRDLLGSRDRGGLEALANGLLADAQRFARQTPQRLAALGKALDRMQADAVPLLSAAQARYPGDFWLNLELGNALYAAKEGDEAISFYRAAAAVRPSAVAVHNNLGLALADKGQLNAAMREYGAALALDPTFALAHVNLGNALYANRELDVAIKEYHVAIALAPNYAPAHNNLGNALHAQQQLDGAIQEYRRAIALDPKFAQPRYNLGHALREKGLLAESLAALRDGHRLGSAQPGWRYPSAQWVQEVERLIEADRKLAAILEGKAKPANDAERLALAAFCKQPFKKRYAASARFYAEAFAHDAKLADDMQAQHCYNAACAAALGGCGQGKDTDKLDEQERVRLRHQAVAWLRADLMYWTRQARSAKPSDRAVVRKRMQHWQQETDLAGLRDQDAVAKLPAGEREACQQLWTDVAEVLKQAEKWPK